MKLFIAVCAGIGFSVLAAGYAQYRIEKNERQRGVALTKEDKLAKVLFAALVWGIGFAIVTYLSLE